MAFTKQDKEYLKQMFADNNRQLGYTIEDKIQEAKEELKAEMKQNRSDIMNHIDSFAGEIKANREERTVQSDHIRRNTKKIEKLEKVALKN